MKEEHKKKISTALKAYHACAKKAGCGKGKKLPKAKMVVAKPRVKVRKKNLYSKTKVRRVEKAENVPSKGSRAGKAIAKKPTTMRSIQAPKKRRPVAKAVPVASGMGGGARPRKTLPVMVDIEVDIIERLGKLNIATVRQWASETYPNVKINGIYRSRDGMGSHSYFDNGTFRRALNDHIRSSPLPPSALDNIKAATAAKDAKKAAGAPERARRAKKRKEDKAQEKKERARVAALPKMTRAQYRAYLTERGADLSQHGFY
tara:strand:+ start:172 stop:951 length:780 start_codon:yes stop_codon:yes gene_type:complete